MEKMQRIDEIKKEMGPFIINIIKGLRPDKVADKSSFDSIYNLLEELKVLHQGEEVIQRELAGILFFLFQTIIVEASYADYPDEIMKEVWKLSTYLLEIFSDNIIQYDQNTEYRPT